MHPFLKAYTFSKDRVSKRFDEEECAKHNQNTYAEWKAELEKEHKGTRLIDHEIKFKKYITFVDYLYVFLDQTPHSRFRFNNHSSLYYLRSLEI